MSSQSFTEELKAAAGDQWERVINHKFTTELASGKIDRNGEIESCEIIWLHHLFISY